jgi:beta-alanine degradation protein BauB
MTNHMNTPTEPLADIANKKIFENDKIAVWEMVLEPGESTGLHTHKHDYMFFVIEGSTGEVTDKDGKVLGKMEVKAGDNIFFRKEGDTFIAGEFRVPATHSARNVGSTRYREILVESK